ncbi:carbohydrate deacetylase [Cohnella faecalis]|uniref:ChbG/HpnK family deacetylase n=1 Tax=Cohnella faecalis TaxID=2315694 RepID=A0A398CN80_9BACL|nr:ChbG/HpnK family deacetylase [Cohnella faecalis]RIE01367.1 ChbG/HpnK family deacetylase [Cohnella faecalis]
MTKFLIVNADDFGLSPGVNRGIAEAFAAGGITSASMMVNMPGFQDAVRLARLNPFLGVGLHFNLTYGKPLSEPRLVPSLVNSSGAYLGIRSAAAWTDKDIATELAAQWNRFVSTGLRPTHLDSHHLLHQNIPSVFNVMASWAEREGIPMRRSQTPIEPNGQQAWTTDYIWLDTYHEEDGLLRLLRCLHNLPDGTTEIMCHPGYADDILRELSEWANVREAEQAVFCHPSVGLTIQALGICPIHYGMLIKKRCEMERIPIPSLAAAPTDLIPAIEPAPEPQPLREKQQRLIHSGKNRKKKRSPAKRRRAGRASPARGRRRQRSRKRRKRPS